MRRGTVGPTRWPPRIPEWLREVARTATGPVPWSRMTLAALAIGVPMIVGVASGQTVAGVFVSMGGLVFALADRVGPYSVRVRRISCAGVFGGVAGLLIGTAINGHGWWVVVVMAVVAALSATLSFVGATWSVTSMNLLIFAVLATGPLGAIKPWWLAPLMFLCGVCWSLLLLVPGRLRDPRAVERRWVATTYRALAANLRALGTERLDAARQGAIAALGTADEDLLGQRAAAGRDGRLRRLLTLHHHAQAIAAAAAALDHEGERPPAQAAAHAEALADAVLDGTAVPLIDPPQTASPAVRALYAALDAAGDVVSHRAGASSPAPGVSRRPPRSARPLFAAAERARAGLTSTFTVRLTLCIAVAAVLSETLPLQRSYWVVLAVAVAMKPDFGSVFARALQYAAGTILGVIVGALILAAQPPATALLVPVVVFSALMVYGMSRTYVLSTVFFTPLVVVLIDLLVHGGWPLAAARLIDVLLGCAIVLCIGFAPRPSSWHAHLPHTFAGAVDVTARYVVEVLGEPAASTSASTHAHARRQLSALRSALQRAKAEPGRTREWAAAWIPAVMALERLLDAVTATAVTIAGQPPAGDVCAIDTALRRLAVTVRSGIPLQPDAPPPVPPSLEPVSEAVRILQLTLTETRRQPPAERPQPGWNARTARRVDDGRGVAGYHAGSCRGGARRDRHARRAAADRAPGRDRG